MANEVTQQPHGGVPDYLRQYDKATIGNIDQSDRIIPRVKLIQALSPELQDYPGQAKDGEFWHTVGQVSLGSTLMGIPIIIRKSYILWAPRNDDRGILARAMDGVHWDAPGMEFTVKPKGSAHSVTYQLKDTVAESRLDQFGSSIPGDPNSPPAASLTYNMLWYLPEYPELSPSVIINTRSGVKPMQQLLAKIDAKPVAHYVQMYSIGIVLQKGPEGPFKNYTYSGAGFADAETAAITAKLYEKFSSMTWQANDERDDVEPDTKSPNGPVVENTDSKF